MNWSISWLSSLKKKWSEEGVSTELGLQPESIPQALFGLKGPKVLTSYLRISGLQLSVLPQQGL